MRKNEKAKKIAQGFISAQKFPNKAEIKASPTHQTTQTKIDAKLFNGFALPRYAVERRKIKRRLIRILLNSKKHLTLAIEVTKSQQIRVRCFFETILGPKNIHNMMKENATAIAAAPHKVRVEAEDHILSRKRAPLLGLQK